MLNTIAKFALTAASLLGFNGAPVEQPRPVRADHGLAVGTPQSIYPEMRGAQIFIEGTLVDVLGLSYPLDRCHHYPCRNPIFLEAYDSLKGKKLYYATFESKGYIVDDSMFNFAPIRTLVTPERLTVSNGFVDENTTVIFSGGRTLQVGKQIGGGGGGRVYEGTFDHKKVAVKLALSKSSDVFKHSLLSENGVTGISHALAFFDEMNQFNCRIVIYEKLYPIKYTKTTAKELLGTKKIGIHKYVTHKDIKPSNLMQRENGQPVFIDFDQDESAWGTEFYQDHKLAKIDGNLDYKFSDVIALARALLCLKHSEIILSAIQELEAQGRWSGNAMKNLKRLSELFGSQDSEFWSYFQALLPHIDHEDQVLLDMAQGKYKDASSAERALFEAENSNTEHSEL